MHTRWRIALFGGLRVEQEDRVITRFRTQKTGALLGYLAYYHQRSHAREVLIDLLWPACDLDVGRNRLSTSLSSLRHQLEPPGVPAGVVIRADRASVRLNPDAVTTDVAEFEAAWGCLERVGDSPECEPWLRRAVDLYQGPLLSGYYEEWIPAEQERLAERFLQALRRLTQHLEQAGDVTGALDHARRAAGFDPLREEAHVELMRLLAADAQPSAALRQYGELERILKEELGATPSATARQLAEAIRRSANHRPPTTDRRSRHPRAPARPSTAPVPQPSMPAAQRTGGNLPLQPNRFFGREEEIARLVGLLTPVARHGSRVARPEPRDGQHANRDPRLVTLTGPGGCGKTRLALEVSGRLWGSFGESVWCVPLADLSEARLILGAVQDALRLPRSALISPLEQVVDALGHRPSLLVLDNLEHLVAEGAAVVRSLLENAPSLVCLVTSRQRLDLDEEREFPVVPLPTPSSGVQAFRRSGVQADGTTSPPHQLTTSPHSPERLNARTPERLMECPSVQLFVDRAQAVRPDFQVTPRNALAVAELCDRLEGIPLALELAAARAQVLTPAQMLEMLGRRFELLVSRRRSATARHRTLRAALEWSYQLLSPPLQPFFDQLSVFRGGWTLEAAQAVCARGASVERSVLSIEADVAPRTPNAECSTLNAQHSTLPLEEWSVLDALQHLRECSLIVAEEADGRDAGGGEMRYRMLESLREFAAERLEPEEQAALERRHAEYFLALAWQTPLEKQGGDEMQRLDRLGVERENFHVAITWGLECAPDLSLTVAGLLGPFWQGRGHFMEGRLALQRALERGIDAPEPLRARALVWAGRLAHWQGDYEEAKGLLASGLVLSRRCGDRQRIAGALWVLGRIALFDGDTAKARPLLEESLTIYEESGTTWDRASAYQVLAHVTSRDGEPMEAHALYEKSLEIHRRQGSQWGIAIVLNDLGVWAYRQGDDPLARAYSEESLRIHRTLRSPRTVVYPLIHLGRVDLRQGRYGEARVHLAEGLTRCRREGDKRLVVECLEALAAVEQAQGRPERAARLSGAAEALREVIGFRDFPALRAAYDLRVAALRRCLGEAAFTTAWESGRILSWQEAADYALDEEGTA